LPLLLPVLTTVVRGLPSCRPAHPRPWRRPARGAS